MLAAFLHCSRLTLSSAAVLLVLLHFRYRTVDVITNETLEAFLSLRPDSECGFIVEAIFNDPPPRTFLIKSVTFVNREIAV